MRVDSPTLAVVLVVGLGVHKGHAALVGGKTAIKEPHANVNRIFGQVEFRHRVARGRTGGEGKETLGGSLGRKGGVFILKVDFELRDII